MNENSEIKVLLGKFLFNQCTPDELAKVVSYFQQNKLTNEFPTVEEIKLLMNDIPEMDNATADKLFSNVVNNAKEIEATKVKSKKKKYFKYIGIAASIVILFSVGLIYQNIFFNTDKPIVIDENQITLQLDNGDIQIISEGKVVHVTDSKGNIIGNQNGNSIVYNSDISEDKLEYNTLKIPNGKRFELKLSDGTSVHLNSGTTLKYPVKFIKGLKRSVYLDGEAFFDVTKDKKHPFIVTADKLNVQVLGTHFNVSNYEEEDKTDVVLVEGSVGMYSSNVKFDANSSTILKPGFKGSFNKFNQDIETKVVDPDLYTSWMKGNLTFKNMMFKNIIKKLERHYDVTIINKNIKLSTTKFSASFDNQSIVKVLSYFSEIQGFNYTIKGKQITIY